jgi:hypothetical protein
MEWPNFILKWKIRPSTCLNKYHVVSCVPDVQTKTADSRPIRRVLIWRFKNGGGERLEKMRKERCQPLRKGDSLGQSGHPKRRHAIEGCRGERILFTKKGCRPQRNDVVDRERTPVGKERMTHAEK